MSLFDTKYWHFQGSKLTLANPPNVDKTYLEGRKKEVNSFFGRWGIVHPKLNK